MSKILIALATYNERENLPVLIQKIFDVIPEAEILVIDDSSPDGTAGWVKEEMQTENRLKLLKRSGKQGLGTAVLAAMDYAIQNNYEFLINMDADLSHPPRFLPGIISKAQEGFGVVIGSRYVTGGKIQGWPLSRRIMSRCINLYARCLLGLKTLDNSGSFRCYQTELLRKLDSNTILSRGYSFFEEVLYRLQMLGGTFAEVPITFEERRTGTSKLNIKEIFIALWLLLRIGIGKKSGF